MEREQARAISKRCDSLHESWRCGLPMNVLRYEVYKNIVDMNDKLTAKDETFCTEFYPVPEREVCENHGGIGASSFGSTVCNARESGYLGSNTLSYLLFPEMERRYSV